MSITVHHGDCIEIIPTLGVMVDAVVTDPPYHLVQIAERSKYKIAYGRDGAMQRLLTGFMGQQWDGGDIAFRPETWAAIAAVMRPGGFLLAFGGTRTYHRMTCAIEDAGFVIQDCIMWLFGSGFPKRRDMLKPAYEPIVLAYKPGGKRTIQVDECRIAIDGESFHTPQSDPRKRAGVVGADLGISRSDVNKFQAAQRESIERTAALGRWPANICHDGSEEVLARFPYTESGLPGNIKPTPSTEHTYGTYRERSLIGHIDSGSAARFFYSAKADKQDRWGSRHPTVKPVDLLKWLVPLVTPPDGTVLDPFAGSGTTGVAALATGRNCILIEREAEYIADIQERLAHYQGEGRHSLAVKARRVADKPLGGLFERPYDADADSLSSYHDAIKACEERYKAGEPLGEFFLSTRKDAP